MSDTPGDMAAKLESDADAVEMDGTRGANDILVDEDFLVSLIKSSRAAASMLRELGEREKALREAVSDGDHAMRYVKMVASQKLSEQAVNWYLDEFGDEGGPDFEGAYDTFIEQARNILNDSARPAPPVEAK